MKKTKFQPDKFKEYYYIGIPNGKFCICASLNTISQTDKSRISQGNCFENRDEAEEKLKEILEIFKK